LIVEAIQFVYWLQGALELGQQKALSEEQVKIVQDHLNLVLQKQTPAYNLPKLSPGIGVRPFELGGIQPGAVVC
jgi:hypothetical protein